jgi:hypothetical protein
MTAQTTTTSRTAELSARIGDLLPLVSPLTGDIAARPYSLTAHRFRQFSVRWGEENALLILLQDLGAAEVNTWHQWSLLGREVRHGETARIAVIGERGLVVLFDVTQTVPAGTQD